MISAMLDRLPRGQHREVFVEDNMASKPADHIHALIRHRSSYPNPGNAGTALDANVLRCSPYFTFSFSQPMIRSATLRLLRSIISM